MLGAAMMLYGLLLWHSIRYAHVYKSYNEAIICNIILLLTDLTCGKLYLQQQGSG